MIYHTLHGNIYLNTPPLQEVFTDLFSFVLHCVLVNKLLSHNFPLFPWFTVLKEKIDLNVRYEISLHVKTYLHGPGKQYKLTIDSNQG